MILLPIGHEQDTVRRLPVVTFTLMALCIVVFFDWSTVVGYVSHKVNYTEKALESAVHLSERYITSRFLPDKAIDVLDESGARARISSLSRPPEIEDLGKEIEEVCGKKEDSISKQQFEDAAC